MLLNYDQVLRIKCGRVGIIPYVKRDNKFYFLMGTDVRTGDMCDFGGGCSKGETNIQAAIREFMEELKEILDPHELDIMSCAVYDERNNICILFCRVNRPGFFEDANEMFHSSQVVNQWDEMSEIEWLSAEDMIKNIYGFPSRFWSRVKYALKNSADFGEELLSKL